MQEDSSAPQPTEQRQKPYRPKKGRKFKVVPESTDPRTKAEEKESLKTKVQAILTAEINRLFYKATGQSHEALLPEETDALLKYSRMVDELPEDADEETEAELLKALEEDEDT